MVLPLFDKINSLPENRLHDKFKLLRDEIQLSSEKKLLSHYTEGLIDRDGKMVRQFQESFHSTYWEICLYQLCLETGFGLEQTHPYPDFVVKSPSEFYIEAVVANIKKAGTPESERTFEDQLSMLLPPHLQEDFDDVLRESITRLSNALSAKIKKYEDYKKASWVDENKPFVIALSSCDQINYGREFIYPMLALLYQQYYIPSLNLYVPKRTIRKNETSALLELGIFSSPQYEHISAVIYTCTNSFGKLTALAISQRLPTYNRVLDIVKDEEDSEFPFKFRIVSPDSPETISDGIFIFHNPYARSPLESALFQSTNVTHIFFENGAFYFKGSSCPLYTRFSTNALLSEILFPFIIEKYPNLNL